MESIEEGIEEDRSAIQEDIKLEQMLEKELQELEKEADRLDEERARRLARLAGESPPTEIDDEVQRTEA